MEKIIELDQKLLVFLNNLGSETFDFFWLFITNQFNLTPVFIFIFYLLWKKVGWKQLGIIILFLAVIILICDQTTNIFKYTFERLRPVNTPNIQEDLRILITRKSFSFFSGHASNSMATTLFIFMILKKHYRYAFLVFLFPLIFAYSRIYLALHFPADILTGYLFGATIGYIFYRLYLSFNKRMTKEKINNINVKS